MIGSQDVEDFFKTLIMGDFVEDQNTAGQVVGGLIAMIPVLEQVMVARDISGALFNINRRGGFAHAETSQIVNLGFAAFGAVPEAGEAFKTVFKPLWKERAAARGAVHGGLEAIESLLGMRKGGAIKWVREELIGKWASWVQRAIAAANSALDACIALTEFVATASGWENWLIPTAVQALAKEMLPSLKKLKGKLDDPLSRAGNEIQEFLKDLVGEQAAAVVVAVGMHAIAASATPAARPKSGHNAADLHPQGHVPARQSAKKVAGANEADARKGSGPLHATMQATRKGFFNMAAREKGLVGEHIVDYYEAARLGGRWPHDQAKASWSPESVSKINSDKRPVNLSLMDLPKICQPGLDAVWNANGHYTVTEAKASESVVAAYAFGKYKVSKGWIPKLAVTDPDLELLHYLLSDNSDKLGQGSPLMQMSREWVEDRAKREDIPDEAKRALRIRNANGYARRTVLVTMEATGFVAHAQALADIHLGKTGDDIHAHRDHGISHQWEAVAIDRLAQARQAAHEAKASKPPSGDEDKSSKPTRTKSRK